MPNNGPATDNDSLVNNSSSAANTDVTEARHLIAKRFREAGLDENRFIRLADGSKAPASGISHSHPKNHLPPDLVDGNYGIYTKGDLVVLDYDPYKLDGDADWVEDFPQSFTVESAHEGRHIYVKVEDDVKGGSIPGGDIQSGNQYVVGPGSELEGCSKDWCDACDVDGQGCYDISLDVPIATVSVEDLPGNHETQEHPSTVDVGNVTADVTALEEVDAPFGKLEIRLEAFLDDEVRKALWEGRYSDADFDDRSTAEGALAWHLGWFLEGESNVVGQFMSLACHRYPRTDWDGPRKWLVRKDDSYREATLDLPDYPFTYDPPRSRIGPRPEVSSVASEKVLTVLGELYPATTKEVANHELVDVGREQTRKALVELMDYDVLARENDHTRPNNPYVYYPAFEDELESD